MYTELDDFTLLTIPLFVLMGAAIGKTRAGADVYGSLNAWLHKVPGGLGLANVFACSVFAAMCGSSPATCSAIGVSGIPQLRQRGYSEGLAAGLIAAGGTLGILIPPTLRSSSTASLPSSRSTGCSWRGSGRGSCSSLLFAGGWSSSSGWSAGGAGARAEARRRLRDPRGGALHAGATGSSRCRALLPFLVC